MIVADQDQVGFWQAGVQTSRADGIVINRFAVPNHDEAGVIDRMDDQVAVRRHHMVAQESVGWSKARVVKPGLKIWCCSVDIVVHSGAAKREQWRKLIQRWVVSAQCHV